jgi:hypothetical protein
MAYFSECSIHGVSYTGYRCPACVKDSDDRRREDNHRRERAQDAEQAEAFYTATQMAEEARHQERLRLEEERWLFSQPEDVRKQWLEKKAADALAAEAAELAMLQEQQRMEGIAKLKAAALIRLNEPVQLWDYKKDRRVETATLRCFGYLVLFWVPVVSLGHYYGFIPTNIVREFNFFDLPYIYSAAFMGFALSFGIYMLIPKSVERFLFGRPTSPRPKYYSIGDLDDQGNPRT